jgi:anti-sigma-K factor RskA
MYDDDRDALAAEYVLGTLSADERDQAEALLAIDPGFAETVRQWERRLGELNVMVEAVEPPPEIWDKIRAEIGGADLRSASSDGELPAIEEAAPQTAPDATPEMTPERTPDFFLEPAPEPPQDLDALAMPQDLDETSPVAALASSLLSPEVAAEFATPSLAGPPSPAKIERSAEIIYLARDARRWRRFTLAAGAIAALLAVYIGVEQFAPGLIPLPRQTQIAVASNTQPTRFVAVLQHEPTAPAFLLTLDPQSRTITVRRVSATAEAGRSYELWLMSSKYPNPRSLGIVGGEQFTARPIPANFDVDTMRSASYAISLEPSGGSPSGVPTGPVLFTGKLVESTPGAPS